jgi:hypothetical protein
LLQPHTGDFCPMKAVDSMGNITCGTGAITSTSITLIGEGEFDLWAQHP